MIKKLLYYNANAFFVSHHSFYGWWEIRDKSFVQLKIELKTFLIKPQVRILQSIPNIVRNIGGGRNIKPYCYYHCVLFILEIDTVGVVLPPLLWYFQHISYSDIVLILSFYIYWKRFDLTTPPLPKQGFNTVFYDIFSIVVVIWCGF